MRETILILIISQAYLIEFVGEMGKNIKKKQIRILYGFLWQSLVKKQWRMVNMKEIQYLSSPEQSLPNLCEEKNHIFLSRLI